MVTKRLTEAQLKARKDARLRDQAKLGAEFRAVRLGKRYTMAELAALLDVHDKTISYWEGGRGKIPGDKMARLMQLPDNTAVRTKPQNAPRTPRQNTK